MKVIIIEDEKPAAEKLLKAIQKADPSIEVLSVLTNVKVLNLLGQELISKKINATSGSVDMSSVADGFYLIEINTEEASKTFKVIKSNK